MVTGSLKKLAEIGAPANPYPGLRPFNLEERHLFFGRDGQSEKLIARLAATRFLAVVGTSGSGKSSLVRAGLLPALLGGMMAGAGSNWRIAVMRPGRDPIGNLALALNEPHVFGSDIAENAAIQIAITRATLRRGNRGLIAAVQQAEMPRSENLLVLVDQFEEIFRFAHGTRGAAEEKDESFENEAAAFVKLLLEAGAQRELPIYVALTMRSDFLGDCSKFWDLPEAINEGQYLVPRLTRDQLREAITGPILVAGGRVAPRLVNRLLNDIGDDQDQLPILQHALMRTWDIWQAGRAIDGPLDTRHYEASGGMDEALSEHADEAFDELNEEQQRIAEKMFKLLTEKGEDNREIRHPVRLNEIRAVAEASEPEIIAVIEKFRQPGRSFLMPPAKAALNADSMIDISHESLIRVWRRLRDWTDEEAASARTYKRLDETAMLHGEGKAELWRGADLDQALEWRERNHPNEVWARRYLPNFDVAMAFLEASRKARHQEMTEKEESRKRQIKRARRVAVISILGALAALALTWYTFNQQQRAVTGEKRNHQLLYAASMGLAQTAFESGNYAKVQELLNQFLPASQSDQEDVRSFCWYYLWRLNHDEKTTLRGHAAPVFSVAFAPDGRTFASASGDKTVRLWDVATGRELATLNGHINAVRAVTFAPDSKTLASAGYDNTIKLWDVASRRELAALKGHGNYVRSVAFAPDGKTLASASGDKTVKLWDVATGQELATLNGHTSYVYSVAFAPDGETLASGGYDDTIRLWDVASRQELATLKGHENYVLSVSFAPDGKTFASSSGDRTIKLWDVTSRQELAILKGHPDDVWSVAFAPDGETLASTSSDNTVKLWNIADRQELTVLKGHADYVYSVAFAPGGKTLVSASADNTVKLWDVPSRQELAALKSHESYASLKGHKNNIRSVAFTSDGRILASAGDDNTVKLWDAANHKELATLKGHKSIVHLVAFAPDGKILASASGDHTVKLWDVAGKQELATLNGHTKIVYAVAFAPDGKTLASASDDNTVKLWDVASRKELATLQGHESPVLLVAFAPDGKILASGGRDSIVKLWDVASRQELATLKGHVNYARSVVFTSDGRTLASASSDNTIKLWEVATGRELATLKGHANSVRSIALAPDGRTLASASSDKTVKLWDVASRQELATLKDYAEAVYSVAFAPDGKILASAGWDKTIRLYFAATDEEVARQKNE